MSDKSIPSSLEPEEEGATGHLTRSKTLTSIRIMCENELLKFHDLNQEVKDKTRTTVQKVVLEMQNISPRSDSSGVHMNYLAVPGQNRPGAQGLSPRKGGSKGSVYPSPLSSGFAEMRPVVDKSPKDVSTLSGDGDKSLETPDEERNEVAKLAQATLIFFNDSLVKAGSPEEAASLLEDFLKQVEAGFGQAKSDFVAGVSKFVRARRFTVWTTLKLFVPCMK